MTIKVSIDAAGGDYGIPVTIEAGINALHNIDDLHLHFVGDYASIESELKKYSKFSLYKNRIKITHASETISMDESPSNALRRKKDSSMRIAINLVKVGEVDACVSAGNTGALMAIARFVLKTINGVDRPAIMSSVPTIKGHNHILDLGANINSKPHTLLQFAIMGSIAVQHTENIEKPSIGLLNIGVEDMKGHDKIQQTADLLKKSSLNYKGFVEGDDIYKNVVDVIVCDGFEGNIALKASEGVANMISFFIKESFNKNFITKIIAIFAKPVMKNFKAKIDPGKHNGASLLGLKGVVIKSHGSADANSFCQAINEAYLEAHAKITEKISKQLTQELKDHI